MRMRQFSFNRAKSDAQLSQNSKLADDKPRIMIGAEVGDNSGAAALSHPR